MKSHKQNGKSVALSDWLPCKARASGGAVSEDDQALAKIATKDTRRRLMAASPRVPAAGVRSSNISGVSLRLCACAVVWVPTCSLLWVHATSSSANPSASGFQFQKVDSVLRHLSLQIANINTSQARQAEHPQPNSGSKSAPLALPYCEVGLLKSDLLRGFPYN